MTTGSTKDYRFGSKNNWRRTIWNEILKRTNGTEKTDPILYLVGPKDMDRIVAVEKGVPNHNLIAIDRDTENVARVKSMSHSAIDSDVVAVLRAWPARRRVSAILLDFCGGLEKSLMQGDDGSLATSILLRNCFAGSVVMINLQRGRDPSSDDTRSVFPHSFMNFLITTSGDPNGCTFRSGLAVDYKNRALMFYGVYIANLLRHLGRFTDQRLLQFWSATIRWSLPVFHSYRSGRLVFDSVVFNPLPLQQEFSGPDTRELETFLSKDQHLSRRIAALLAVRTSRINKGLG